MLFLIYTVVIYIVLESLLKIEENENIGVTGIKSSTILFFSVLAVNLTFGKSFMNLLFSVIIICIVATIRKDSMYKMFTNDVKFDEFKNLISPSKEKYYKFFKNIKNSFSRVYNKPLTKYERESELEDIDEINKKLYSLKALYPKIPTTTPDKKIVSFQEPAKMTVEYDEELHIINEGLMNDFWLTEDKTEYKVNKDSGCNQKYVI
jgi:hypothetical protein